MSIKSFPDKKKKKKPYPYHLMAITEKDFIKQFKAQRSF